MDVYENVVLDGWLYDMNSQYPAAMKNPIPIGKPVFTNESNLYNIFGFVFANVVAPSKEELRVPILPFRDTDTNEVHCPRGSFSGI